MTIKEAIEAMTKIAHENNFNIIVGVADSKHCVTHICDSCSCEFLDYVGGDINAQYIKTKINGIIEQKKSKLN